MTTPRLRTLSSGLVIAVAAMAAIGFDHQVPPQGLTRLPSMREARASHTATLLPDGKVLIAGGFKKGADGYSQIYFSSAELFDPVVGSFTPTGSMHASRCGHTATLLPGGKVLVTGGFGDTGLLNGAELYDPAAGTWSQFGNMHQHRSGHTATLLKNGFVLLAGGGERVITSSAELFDGVSKSFRSTGSMRYAREGHTATLLSDGSVIILGGASEKGKILATAERYDPSTGTFRNAGSMRVPRYKHAAIETESGEVLVLGGSDEHDWTGKYNSAEIYHAGKGVSNFIDTMRAKRFKFPHSVVMLPTGDVLVGGGGSTIELFVMKTKSFVDAGRFDDAQYYGSATLLNNGSVLITGGYNNKPQSTNKAWVYR
jgi:hypothetical protein